MLIVITGWSPVKKANHRRTEAFQALAMATDRHKIPLVITNPKQLHGAKHFQGWTCLVTSEGVKWSKSTWNLGPQTVVFDAMYLRDLKTYQATYKPVRMALRKQKIPVFNPVLPSKDELYRILTRKPIQGGRLPTTELRVSADGVLRMLERTDKLWLKPVFGSGGRNIAYISRLKNGKFLVIAERHQNQSLREEMGSQRLREFVKKLTRTREYMAQEHVDLISTSDGRKVDFRVTVQRRDSGAWGVTATTVRIGGKGSVLTNFHAGGMVRSLTNLTPRQRIAFLAHHGVPDADVPHMNELALRIARRLQSYYPTLGILGLDVGQTSTGEFFVYDFNGRPGRDILTDDEVVVYMDSVAGFAKYLSELNNRQPNLNGRPNSQS